MTDPSPSSSSTTKKSTCSPCMALLKQVLSTPTSRPHILLQTFHSHEPSAPPFLRVESLNQERIHVSMAVPSTTATSNNNNNNNNNNASGAERSDTMSPHLPRYRAWQDVAATAAASLRSRPTAMATSASTSPSSSSLEWLEAWCKDCDSTGPEGGSRAFVMGPQPLSIVVCSNRLQQHDHTAAALAEMEEILTHELIHVHDIRRLQLDLRDCDSLAYSEVRAAREAECAVYKRSLEAAHAATSWYQTHLSSNCSHRRQQQLEACVRQKASSATRNMFPGREARQCLDRVFAAAMRDRRPFVNATSSSSFTSSSPTPLAFASQTKKSDR